MKKQPIRKKKDQTLFEESAHFLNSGSIPDPTPKTPPLEEPVSRQTVEYEVYRTYDTIETKDRETRR
jgi:hypothetical protein